MNGSKPSPAVAPSASLLDDIFAPFFYVKSMVDARLIGQVSA